MPTIEAFLTSIQDALSCIESKASKGWPADIDNRQMVQELLSVIDGQLWELCESGRTTT